jgi:hypothetical protein
MADGYVPDVLRPDAPTPDTAAGETVGFTYTTTDGMELIAVDHNGERYCIDCATMEYIREAHHNPDIIPAGGAVREGAEVDCPGSTCGHCHRRIRRFTVLHYDGVCQPETCPQMDSGGQ